MNKEELKTIQGWAKEDGYKIIDPMHSYWNQKKLKS